MRKGLSCLLIFMFLWIMVGRCLAGEIEEKVDRALNIVQEEFEKKGEKLKLSEVEKRMVKEKCRNLMDAVDECAFVYSAKYSCFLAKRRMYDIAVKEFSMKGAEKVKIMKAAGLWSELCEGACRYPMFYSNDRDWVISMCVIYVLAVYGKI